MDHLYEGGYLPAVYGGMPKSYPPATGWSDEHALFTESYDSEKSHQQPHTLSDFFQAVPSTLHAKSRHGVIEDNQRRNITAAVLGLDPNLDSTGGHHATHHYAHYGTSAYSVKQQQHEGPATDDVDAPVPHLSSSRSSNKHDTTMAQNRTELCRFLQKLKETTEKPVHGIDSFMVSERERQDLVNFITQIINTIVLLLAYGLSRFLEWHQNLLITITILYIFLFLYSQVRYAISHLNNKMQAVRQSLERQERSDASIDAAVAADHSERADINYSALEDDQKQQTHNPYEEQQLAEFNAARNRGVSMLTMVRLGSYSQSFSVLGNVLLLNNTLVIFMLIRSIMDKLDPNFSDGVWMSYHVLQFLLVIGVFYVLSATSAYRPATATTDN
jgi:hypothetical protein